MSISKELLQKHRVKMPPELLDAFGELETAEKIEKIYKESDLRPDQGQVYMEEVDKMFLGITQPSEFVARLKKIPGLEGDTAEKLAQLTNERIFKPFKHSIIRMHQQPSQKDAVDKNSLIKEIEKEDAPSTVAPTRTREAETPVVPKMVEKVMEKEPQEQGEGGSRSIIEQKLKEPVRAPSSERIIENRDRESENAFETPLKKKEYGGVDPYREPIE